MSSLNKGQKIADRYVLMSRLGNSDYAQSWLARDLQGRGEVVIKVASDAANSATARALVANEHTLGSRLNHPSVVRYFDLGQHDGHAYLTREFCSGGDISALKRRPWQQILPPMAQLADALFHVHEAGLVHRDVKAQNVLMTAEGRARLMDFGVASEAGAQGLRSGGSPATISPEQRDGAPPGPADDAWSFGTLLAHLLQIETSSIASGEFVNWPGDAPDALKPLLANLLHADPRQRLQDLAQVARALEAIVDGDRNATLPPEEFVESGDQFDSIEPISPVDNATPAPLIPREPGGRRGVPRSAGVIALSLLIVTAFGAIYFLRTVDPVATPSTARTDAVVEGETASTGSGRRASTPEQAVEPWQLAQEARLRAQSEEELEQLLDRQFTLDEKKVEIWAAAEYEAATQHAIAGDRAFRRQDFQGAFDQYKAGNDLLGTLLVRSENLIGENIDAGFANIDAGKSAAAAENFELVLKVEPRNARAATGLRRAQNLDQVLALVEQATELEQYGEPAKALALYREAAALDPKWSDASTGVRRVDRAMAGSRFSAAMSDGYAALQSSRFEAARAAFDRAERIRGGTADVRDAREQLALAQRSAGVSSLRDRAAALERSEDFAGALAVYREARALDPNLAFARDGEARNAARVELLETIDAYNDDPDRLVSDSVFENARAALQRAQGIEQPGRALTTAAARLQAHLATSRITSMVTLSSDNLTDVLVYRVGRLGRFASQEVELRPGRYTAVGSRAGYRDVRREFRVGPGGVEGAVDIRCEERI
ncbi:MAG: protein kinase [Gammaproteobacteria bacterium]